MSRKYTISLLVLFCSAFAQAQYLIRNYYNLTGKKDIPVNLITQDYSGFLWLGTNEGVFKFNGKTAENPFEEFKVLSKAVTALYVDLQEKVWIGMQNGKVYTVEKNKLDSIILFPNSNGNKITSFCELGSRIIISTYGSGLFIKEADHVSSFNVSNGLSDGVVYKCITDKENRLWCATDAGISELTFVNKDPEIRLLSNKLGLPDNIVRDIQFRNNKLLISMQDSGICYFNLKNSKFEKKTFFSEWTMGPVLNAFAAGDGKTIVATENNGLMIFNNSSIRMFGYGKEIQCTSISQAFLDRENQLWLAGKKGICQVVEKRHELIGKSHGLMNEKVLALAIDNDQSVWIGTSTGISKIMKDEKGDLVIRNLDKLSKYSITCAAKAPDGDIWFGTYGQGIIVLNTKTDNSVIINTGEDKISDNNISHIYFQNQHTLYISTLGGGLIKASVDLEGDYKLFNVEKVYTDKDGLSSNYIYASISDSLGNLFAATDGGGLQMLRNDTFINLTKSNRFSSTTAFSLCRDKFNNIWFISNEDGIVRYNGRELQKFGLKEGLRDNQPQQIIGVGPYVYSIHSKGIDKIHGLSGHISYIDFNTDELEPNLNAIVHNHKYLYSGTGSGILMIRTSAESSDSIAPKISLSLITLNYKPLNADSLNDFRYNQNNFGFTFTGIWLKNPDRLKYRYKLHGFEDNWNYTNEGKQVLYNNLNPGNYTFIAQVQNEEEIWSEPVAYAFSIQSPVWKRWWFWVLLLSALVFGIYLFIRLRLRTLQKEKQILENKVKERTAEIEKQSLVIVQKNKDITDSISYARKIQYSILPPSETIRESLPDSFVVYMTKDIVSGDFYWFSGMKDFCIIAAVDCTGHGVPGAFMSLIGYNLLNKIVNEQNITDPKEILLALNNGVIDALYRNESESKDGMDIAICKINHRKKTLEYAGAMRPLWVVENNELREIKADKIPIGTKPNDRQSPILYTTHTISLSGQSVFYIFTDGYADQFGGPKEKKYSTGKFKELLFQHHKKHFDQQSQHIIHEHLDWKGEHEQVDDILVIGFKA